MLRATTPARSTTPDDGDGPAYPELRDEPWLREEYIEQRRPLSDIAAELGCNKSTVSRWLSRHGIETCDRGADPTPRYPELRDKDWLREQYVEQGRLLRDIAAELDCDLSTVSRWLSRHEIPARSPGPRSDGG